MAPLALRAHMILMALMAPMAHMFLLAPMTLGVINGLLATTL